MLPFNHIVIRSRQGLGHLNPILDVNFLYEVRLELGFVMCLLEIIVLDVKLDGEEKFRFKVELEPHWQTN